MRVAVLSGKGGTGKTLVTVNLAAVAAPSVYVDCDVEEPNGHLFFKPGQVQEEPVTVLIPHVDPAACTGCRKCVEFCNFNALAYASGKLIVFDDICHSCGGCVLVCPEGALSEKDKAIGCVQRGTADRVEVYTGILNTGEATGIPIIHRLLEQSSTEEPLRADSEQHPRRADGEATFIDCPPGSACIVMESIKDADYCILVAEPTIFGMHNLRMVHELVMLFEKPFGVVLNKCLEGENPSEAYCVEHGIKILSRIPFDHELGALNSDAKIVANESDVYRDAFRTLLEAVKEEVGHEAAAHS